MEWQFVLLIIFISLLILMSTGMPIFFCFMSINVVGMYVFFGGSKSPQPYIAIRSMAQVPPIPFMAGWGQPRASVQMITQLEVLYEYDG